MTKSHRIFNKPELKQYRKTLREKSTSAEVALWNLLKNKQLEGRKFRRQYSLGKYIADFCCPAEKLIIELDGQVHADNAQIEKDIIRDQNIENLGFVILRFENKLVFEVPEFVLTEIKNNFRKEG
jgi:very-short-patch-repair endonuclease